MNIKQFLNNPTGKGSVIPGKGAILNDLDRRYRNLTSRNDFDVNIYLNKNNVYFHILVLTEDEERDNTYDVVLEFIPNKISKKDIMNIKNYDIRFFSNSPSFVYTYAYVAKLNDMLINQLSDKYDKKILKYPPVSRNPSLMMNYEKSIYFACKYLLDNNLLNKAYINTNAKKDFNKLIKSIRKDSVILEEIQRAKSIKKAKKEDRKKPTKGTSIRNIGQSKKTKSSVNYIKPIKKKTSTSTVKPNTKKTKSSVKVIKKR